MNQSISEQLRLLPAVDRMLNNQCVKEYGQKFGVALATSVTRSVLDSLRESVRNGQSEIPSEEALAQRIVAAMQRVGEPSLRRVLNGSGIVLHTNLGRAPLGEELLRDVSKVLEGYTNLEFDLESGARGDRNSHAAELIRHLTGAEDILIVNNNAAAVLFILSALAAGKECVVSRGELIEIGGSFRIPDIMAASGACMREIGTTNKTRRNDYEQAIGEHTALLFKAHRSNFAVRGFTEEIALDELAALGKERGIPTLYDIGSGLLRKVDDRALAAEPDVRSAISAGIDLVCFSGDKLLGAAQAGIIAGRKCYIDRLRHHPMLRALRVCKTTLAILETACSYYLNDRDLFSKNILFRTLTKSPESLQIAAEKLCKRLSDCGLQCETELSEGQYGGGTLPDVVLESRSVKIILPRSGIHKELGNRLYHALLEAPTPLLTNLKAGEIYIDLLCLQENELESVAQSVLQAAAACNIID